MNKLTDEIKKIINAASNTINKERLLMQPCSKCNGTGWHMNDGVIPCDMCDGRGWYVNTVDIDADDIDIIFPRKAPPAG